jgi:hypothetical protein
VRKRRGGQETSDEVECLRANRPRVRSRRLVLAACELPVDPRRRLLEQARVRFEDVVECELVRRAEPGVAVVAVAEAFELVVVRDVSCRLLEIGGKPWPLQELRQQVGRPLARDVRPAELRDGVVAVAEEDPLVQL